ncbi:UNVERIFIED_CONTAM: hypothetical protein GTU68_013509 [Idotea baltica]|nr:hypothetical protein [Idotea baltica]
MDYLNIDNKKIVPVVSELNVLLAEYHVHYQKLRNFHWNILGENFFDLHKKFEELYDDTKIKIDEVAERIITLKYHPISQLSDYLEVSKIRIFSLLSDKKCNKKLVKPWSL